MRAIKHTFNYIMTGGYLSNGEPLYREKVEILTEAFSIPNLFDRPSKIEDFGGNNVLQIPLDESEVPDAVKKYIENEVDATFIDEAARQYKSIGFQYVFEAFREGNDKDAFMQCDIDAVTKDGRWDDRITVYLTKAEYQALGAKLDGMRKHFKTDSMNRDYLYACSEHSINVTLGDKTYTVKIPALTDEIEKKIINAVGTTIKVTDTAEYLESLFNLDFWRRNWNKVAYDFFCDKDEPFDPESFELDADVLLSYVNRYEFRDTLETIKNDLWGYCIGLAVEEMKKINDIPAEDADDDYYIDIAEKYGLNEWFEYITPEEWEKRFREIAEAKKAEDTE